VPFPIQSPKVDAFGPAYGIEWTAQNGVVAGNYLAVSTPPLAAGDYEIECRVCNRTLQGVMISLHHLHGAAIINRFPAYCRTRGDTVKIPRVTVGAGDNFQPYCPSAILTWIVVSIAYRRVG
jgi:hypothetical protein